MLKTKTRIKFSQRLRARLSALYSTEDYGLFNNTFAINFPEENSLKIHNTQNLIHKKGEKIEAAGSKIIENLQATLRDISYCERVVALNHAEKINYREHKDKIAAVAHYHNTHQDYTTFDAAIQAWQAGKFFCVEYAPDNQQAPQLVFLYSPKEITEFFIKEFKLKLPKVNENSTKAQD